MTLPVTDKFTPPAYSLVARVAGLLWSLPIPAQLYGESNGADVILISNHRPLVNYLVANQNEVNVLALDADGFTPAASCAFGHVREDWALQALKQFEVAPGARVFVPASMAQALRWQDGQQVGEWEAHILPDTPTAMLAGLKSKVFAAPNTQSPVFLRRVLFALGLCLGQMLLFAAPLWLFGLEALALGLGTLMISSLLLALIWGISPCCGGAKGLLVGFALASLATLMTILFVQGGSLVGLVFPFLGVCILSFWMGMVMNGAK